VRPLVLIGVAGALVRVAYTLVLGRHVELGISDATFYSGAANLLAQGEGYVDVWRSLAEGETLRTAHHPPGWPALLSVFSFVGVDSELGHRLVGAVLGGVVVVAIGVVAMRVAGRTAGLVAAAIGALHPTLVAADGSLMAETFAGLAVLVIVLLALSTAEDPRWPAALALGAAIGAGTLVRGEALLYLPLVVLPVALVVARRRAPAVGAGIAALALVGVLALVGPWAVRNTLLFDEVVLISTNDSTVLAGANCEPAYRGPGIGGWHLDCVRPVGGTEVEEAAAWRTQGLDFLGENRGRLPVVVAARVARTWGFLGAFPPVAEGRHAGTQAVGNVVWLVLLLPGAVAGAVVLGRRRRLVELGVLLAPVGAATAVSILGFGMLRFRHPMELSAVVLAAVALATLWPRVPAVLRSRHASVPDRSGDGDPRAAPGPPAGAGRR
jgi:4-amino-4-deoxy-L-arabinose transferase-like glycosyltransferase